MKRSLFALFSLVCLSWNVFPQTTDSFDISTFSAPKGWTRQAGQDAVQFSIADNDSFCLITLFKSVPSLGSPKENFDAAWSTIVKEAVTVTAAPQILPSDPKGQWQISAGFAPFEKDGSKGVAILFTATDHGSMVNALILTNTDAFEAAVTAFLGSISFKAPKSGPPPPVESGTARVSVVGNWGKSNAVSQLYNRFGTYSYNKQQYTFKTDGTYGFLAKNYSDANDETLLIRETGTYTISGNSLTIIPRSSVVEAWSKKNGGDNWNILKSSQKRALERAAYQFEIQQNNLVLQAPKETLRDGRFNNGSSYIYGPPGTFTAIKLPGEK